MIQKKAIIIGSGVGGIGAAIRLAAKGYETHIFEAHATAGGKLAQMHVQGFRFDRGPSLFTMPQYVVELFELHGKRWQDYFAFEQLPVVCQYFYEDGTKLTAYADAQLFQQEICEKLGENPAQIAAFFQKAKELYDITGHVFLEKSLHKLSTYLNSNTLRSLMQVHKLDVFQTMHQANAKRFRNEKTVQLFDRYATYNGSDPYQAPATLNIISHLEHEIGAFFPKKGMYAIVEALMQLASEVGVRVHYNTPVQEILLEGKKAVGIRTAQGNHAADVVVSNMDISHTYRQLLPQAKPPKRTLAQQKSSSALIFYWGMSQEFPELDLHNIFFSENYKAEFEAMFQQRIIYSDPTVYVFVSSKAVREDAPAGMENWFVMVNAPYEDGQDWDALIAETRANIQRKLARILGREIAPLIVCEDVLDPRGIASRTFSEAGALYGSSSNSKWAAFMRHPNFSGAYSNLYFCGGSVHPGGGIPLCLLSAKIVADLVE